MTNYHKAFDELIKNRNDLDLKDIMNIIVIRELVDKATPFIHIETGERSDFMFFLKCGKCSAIVGKFDCYCSHCGQRIDWSKEND